MKSIFLVLAIISGVFLYSHYSKDTLKDQSTSSVCSFDHINLEPPDDNYHELSMLNDESLVWPLPLECKPDSFGYTLEEGISLFPDKTFPSCEKPKHSPNKLHINTTTNTLSMDCSGKYLLGPTSEDFGKVSTGDLERYHSETNLTTEEYAIGTCDKDSSGFFEYVEYKNQLNLEALKRAKKSLNGKPVNIAVVVLDSVSRRSFYRKLPNTIEYLMQSPQRFHDFYIHNVMGEFSADSFMPTFLGDIPFGRLSEEDENGNPYGGQLIWDYLYKNVRYMKGFVTYVATDDCGGDLSSFIGRKAEIDHKISSFWCAAKRYYNFKSSLKMQRCIGPKNAHTYMFDYLIDFSQNYAEVSRFSYIHLNTAHEGSGTVISTLDDDLLDFLKKFQSLQEDSVIFLMGDHGMRYGSWFTQIDGSHEHRLPLLMVATSKSWQESHPHSEAFLEYNSKRLVTKLDLNVALRYLANSTHFDHDPLKFVCETSVKYRSYNIFSEAIDDSRDCPNSGIPLFWCSCMPFKDMSELKNSVQVKRMAEEVINSIDEQSYTVKGSSLSICQKLSLKKVSSVSFQETENQQYFNIKFNIKQSKKVLFEALVLISDTQVPRRAFDGFGTIPFFYSGKQYMKIMYIKRLDAYAGLCQDISLIKHIDPMLCVCKSFKELKEQEPEIIDEIYSIREVITANGTCEDTCYANGMSCDEFALDLYKDCKNFHKDLCGKCEESEREYNYQKDNVCYIRDDPVFSCTDKYPNGLCYCKKSHISSTHI